MSNFTVFFDGALDPTGGTVIPGASVPGLGLTLRGADIGQYRVG